MLYKILSPISTKDGKSAINLSNLGHFCCKPGCHGQKPNQLIWPKVLWRGHKRSLRKWEQKARCTGATWGCTGANLVCTGASDFWETLGPSGQKTFCTPARQLSVICAKLTSVHGALVCNTFAKFGPRPFIYVRPVGGPENYLC